MDGEILPGEQFIEDTWNTQRGCDPITGKAWLTPRMERNAAASRIAELESSCEKQAATISSLQSTIEAYAEQAIEDGHV
jgi:hypothetical protein